MVKQTKEEEKNEHLLADEVMKSLKDKGSRVTKSEIAKEVLARGYTFEKAKKVVDLEKGIEGLTLTQGNEARIQADRQYEDIKKRDQQVTKETFTKELLDSPLSFEAVAIMVRYKFQG